MGLVEMRDDAPMLTNAGQQALDLMKCPVIEKVFLPHVLQRDEFRALCSLALSCEQLEHRHVGAH
jgi:hypothetical protein